MVGVGVLCTVRVDLAMGVVCVARGRCVGFFAAVVKWDAGCAKTENTKNPIASTISVLIKATLRMGNRREVARPCAGVPAWLVDVCDVCGFIAGNGPDCWNGRTNCALHPAASS